MGTMLNPVGPLPPRAYWLRRLLALLLVVLVVAFIWWLLAGIGGGSPGAAGPTTSGSPSSSSPSATTSASQTPSTTSPSPTTSSPKPSSTASPGLCADSVIKVVASTDKTSYPAGESPHLTVQVTNTSSSSCKRDVGQVALELIVSSGSTRVWSSDDCNPGGGHAVVTLKPQQTFATTVVWGREHSAPGCPSGKPKAAPGHYTVVARNLTLTSAAAPFQLL